MHSEEDQSTALPAPERNLELVGHEAAETELLSDLRAGRFHHAWLIGGPKGVGKATLAFRLARFLLHHGGDTASIAQASSLAVPADAAAARHVASGAAHGLLVLRRETDEKTGRLKTVITVDQVRRLQSFFAMAAGAGAWRIAIIDTADELNRNAANALLKILEEPPQRSLLILLANAPGRMLATIRSRSRALRLRPLDTERLASTLPSLGARFSLPELSAQDRAGLANLAGGSIGRALELWESGGLDLARLVDQTLNAWPDLSPHIVSKLLDRSRSRPDFEEGAALLVQALRSAARCGALDSASVERCAFKAAARLAKGAPAEAWANLAGEIENAFARGLAVHLDHKAMMAEALRRIAAVAERMAAA